MNARPTPMLSWAEANGLQQTTKDPTDGRPIETPPPNGDEQELVLGGDSPAMLEIAVQASYCRLMKRDAPALVEFCLAHEQCLRVEVIELESERFRDSQSRDVNAIVRSKPSRKCVMT